MNQKEKDRRRAYLDGDIIGDATHKNEKDMKLLHRYIKNHKRNGPRKKDLKKTVMFSIRNPGPQWRAWLRKLHQEHILE